MSGVAGLPTVSALERRKTTPDYVAEVLRDGILTGRLADGEELNQVALAHHFDVSRVPIREALRQLQAEGLIRQEAHRRAVVATLTRERVMELFDLRVRLETYLLEQALPRITAEDLDAAQELERLMEATEDHDEWLQLNRAFHRTFYAPSETSYTLELAETIAARTTRYLYQASGGTGLQFVDEPHREHRALLEAIRQADSRVALRTLTEHIEGTRRRVKTLFDALGTGQDGARRALTGKPPTP